MEEKDIKEKIKKELQTLEKMINSNKEKKEIESQRKKLDTLLEEYVKDIN